MGELGAHIGIFSQMRISNSQKADRSESSYRQTIREHIFRKAHAHSFTHVRSVAIAQLRCGRHEDCDDVRERRRLRLLLGSFLMLHLTFTLGSCGLWLLLTEMIQPAVQHGNYSDRQLGTREIWGWGCVHILYWGLPTHGIWHNSLLEPFRAHVGIHLWS